MLRQLCDEASDTVLIENNGITKNGLLPQSGATPLFSMRTISLVSSQSCRSNDADAWCKRALTADQNLYDPPRKLS